MKMWLKKIAISVGVIATLLIPFSPAKAQTVTLPPVYNIGDIIYASATKTLSKLGIGSSGTCLQPSAGVPAWVSCLTTEAGIEAVVDLQDLQGAVTDAQVPNNITIDSATSASDLSCTDCIGPTEITDSYVLNTGDLIDGLFQIGNGATSAGSMRVLEDTDNGANYWQLSGASSLASNVTCTIDASGQIPDACVGNGTDDDTATPSVGSAGAIQFSDGAGAFLGSLVDNLFYNSSTDVLYLLDDTTTYFKAGAYDTGFNFNANNISSGLIHTLTVPDADLTLVGSDVSNLWTAKQTFGELTGTQAGINVGALPASPSSQVDGDLWYDFNTDELMARINGADVALGSGGGSGTVTHTGGALTSNSVVLGAGTDDVKVVSGITTDGTSQLNLGVNATTLGKLKLFGNTSGDVTLQPNAVAGTGIVLTLPATTGTLVTGGGTASGTNTGDQTITLSGDISGTGTSGITTTIGADKVLESMLKAVDTPADEEFLTYESTTGDFEWQSGGSGAPTTADYLVGTADGGLSAEIVVGTSPGGELGGTWASPTLDDNVTTTGWTMGTFSGTQLTSSTVLVDLLDAVGAVDMDYGSADVTDHTFVTDGTGTAEIVLPAGSIDGTEILNDTVALTTDTSGNYVGNVSTDVLTGLTGGSAGSEGASLSLAFDYSQVLSGDAGLASKSGVFGASGLVFEGDTADTIETFISVTDPTASDKTITIPNRSGTVSLSGDTFTGDVTGTLNSSGATGLTIGSDKVLESMLKAVDSAVDEECLTYETTTGDFEWQSCGSGSGDITAVGDASTGDAFTGTSGTTLTFDDADGDKTFKYDTTNNWFEVNAGLLFGSAGMRLTGSADGDLTFLPVGDGTADNDEDLTLNLEDTANTASWSSSTGVTEFDLGTLDLNTDTIDLTGTGTLNGLDAIDATTETTLESALDIAGDVTGTGLGTVAITADVVDFLNIDYSPTLSGNPALGAGECFWGSGSNERGIVCEGATADTIEMALKFPDPATSDKTLTLPNATDTLVGQATTDTLTNKTIASASNVVDACIPVAVTDEYSNLTTGTAKVSFRMPFAMTVTSVRASLVTVATGATLVTVDINEAGTSIISTKLTFDASELTTTTSATPAVISDSALADDALMTVDIDAVGNTTPGNGLKISICGTI